MKLGHMSQPGQMPECDICRYQRKCRAGPRDPYRLSYRHLSDLTALFRTVRSRTNLLKYIAPQCISRTSTDAYAYRR